MAQTDEIEHAYCDHENGICDSFHEVWTAHMPDMDRCPAFSTDDQTCRYARDDGWRCGESAGTPHNHTLYSADGERTLYSSGWYVPRHAAVTE